MPKAEPVIKLLESFSVLVTKILDSSWSRYKDAIVKFSSAYRKLNQEDPKTFAITPKIHIVMFHVLQYLELLNAETGEEQGLGYIS